MTDTLEGEADVLRVLHQLGVSDTDFRGLLEQLAPEDPLTWSIEGLDDGCFFCGAAVRSGPSLETFARHQVDCPWVVARVALAQSLGLHEVEVEQDEELGSRGVAPVTPLRGLTAGGVDRAVSGVRENAREEVPIVPLEHEGDYAAPREVGPVTSRLEAVQVGSLDDFIAGFGRRTKYSGVDDGEVLVEVDFMGGSAP